MSSGKGPVLLAIVDGWGDRDEESWNAIKLGPANRFRALRDQYPSTSVFASGQEVGLPLGLMGNSEVGHLNIGAGRIVWQDIERINRSIEDGSYFENPAFHGAVKHALETHGKIHLMGLVSDGGVHSLNQHYRALLELLKKRNFSSKKVFFHAFLDGRDTPPKSAKIYLEQLEDWIRETGMGRIATVSGRYYAMDRDKRWNRTQKAYDTIVKGMGKRAASAVDALAASYREGISDEFLVPTVIESPFDGRVEDGDAILAFNFRADRMRQLIEVLTDDGFSEFPREMWGELYIATMTEYRSDFPVQVAFPSQYLKGIFGEAVSQAGLRQLRIAETEKYAHVTYFFNGGDEKKFEGEDRILIPSPKVATYDLFPEMSAEEVTRNLMERIEADQYQVYVLNYANPDMVGHTGDFEAACEAVRLIDKYLGELSDLILKKQGMMAITADHGNCEFMFDEENQTPHTAHTTNPVPLLLISEAVKGMNLKAGGKLGDVTPTLLHVMGLDAPAEMTGENLLF